MGATPGNPNAARNTRQTERRVRRYGSDEDYRARTRQRMNESRYRRRQRNVAWVTAYLAEHPCVDCGEDDRVVLDFDHVRPGKTNGVGRLVQDGRPLTRIAAEVELCEVRCANCHRRVTHARRVAGVVVEKGQMPKQAGLFDP